MIDTLELFNWIEESNFHPHYRYTAKDTPNLLYTLHV